MSKLVFIGAAQALPQIDTITLGGTWSDGETATIEVGAKSVTYTVQSGDDAAAVAAGLQALLAAANEAEIRESTWTVATTVVTSTSAAATPITITVSEASASGTIVLANTQAATGPNHWDNADNWSTGSVPVNSDEVFVEDTDVAILHGLPTTSLSLTKLVVLAGQVGNPDRNPSGYPEYRTLRAAVTCTDVTIGESARKGPSLARIDLGTSAAAVAIFGTQGRGTGIAADILVDSASANVSVIAGSAGLAIGGDETATVGTLRVGREGAAWLGEGLTVTSVISSGTTTINCNATNLTVEDGTTLLYGSAAISGTTEVRGGVLDQRSSGTIADMRVGPGLADFSGDNRTRTVSAAKLRRDGAIFDPYNVVTFSAGVTLDVSADTLRAE